VRFFAGIGPAHFPADLRNAALSAFEEGAPFMGTALAEYKQCIGAEVVCHFHRQRKILRFAQIFEDERGLASSIVMLARIIA
jgi:hypothetical protein